MLPITSRSPAEDSVELGVGTTQSTLKEPSGLHQGGFYDTGIQGTSGKECQAMYQPAAAAEARFAATLRTTGSSSSSNQSDPDRADMGEGAGSSSMSSAEGGAPEAATSPATGSTGTSERLQEVPAASKALVREILQADNRQRTKELVDSAWQSLE
eukprot:gene3755-biopygen5436